MVSIKKTDNIKKNKTKTILCLAVLLICIAVIMLVIFLPTTKSGFIDYPDNPAYHSDPGNWSM